AMPPREDDDERRPSLADAADGFGPPASGRPRSRTTTSGLNVASSNACAPSPAPCASKPHISSRYRSASRCSFSSSTTRTRFVGEAIEHARVYTPGGELGSAGGGAIAPSAPQSSRRTTLAHRIAVLGCRFEGVDQTPTIAHRGEIDPGGEPWCTR